MLSKDNIKILMCCSDLDSVKGGMVTVTKNYLESDRWNICDFIFIPTHIEAAKLKKAFYFLGAYFRVLALLLRGRVDAAHLHTAERGSFYRKAYIQQLCQWFKVPVILHHHSAEFEDFYKSLSKRKKNQVRRVLEKAQLNLVLSPALAGEYQRKAPAARIEVLYNAVKVPETNPYSADAETAEFLNVLVLGRLGKRKGTYDFLGALKLAEADLPSNTRCYLCGDGEVEQVKAAVQKAGLGHLIAYIGWVDKELKEQFLTNAVIHILPSYWEGLPMSILETMARGIPNISTAIASIPEVIKDGENGYLIQPGDVTALAGRMTELLNCEEVRSMFSQNSFQLIQDQFSFEQTVARMENYYRELTNSTASGELEEKQCIRQQKDG